MQTIERIVALTVLAIALGLSFAPATPNPGTCRVTYARPTVEWRQCSDGTVWQVEPHGWTRQPQLETGR